MTVTQECNFTEPEVGAWCILGTSLLRSSKNFALLTSCGQDLPCIRMMVGEWASEQTSPLLALLLAGALLAETEGVEDLAVGRLPKTASVSVPWGFEKFDGVAGGVL